MSASRRKLAYFADVKAPTVQSTLPTTIVDLNCLQGLLQGVVCSDCGSSDLKLQCDADRIQGLAVPVKLYCGHCQSIRSQAYTSKKCSAKVFQHNRGIVFASLYAGIGYAHLAKFSEVMGLEMLTCQAFNDHVKLIEKAMSVELNSIFDESAEKVKAAYSESENPHNIAVSYDGTWAKRGHTSKLGVGVVIDVKTGLAIDSHVMSTYCQQCSTVGDNLKKSDPEKHLTWYEGHKAKCSRNFSGSSGAMEVEAAKKMWGRSEARHQLRYTTIVSDGDTKTYSALLESRPYRHMIEKQECINHVAKRLNTALRNLVNAENKRGVRLGGAGLGNLTQTKMGLLQSYYTKAVRTYNGSVQEMSDAIWAAFFHSTSTDKTPQHHKCPGGQDSWCFYQRSKAKGLSVPSHKGRLTTYLNEKVAPYVEAIYRKLTEPALLKRCLLGKTQNTNESLHGMIWSRCPKHIFNGLSRVTIGTAFAIGEFNQGSAATHRFQTAVGCSLSEKGARLGQLRDEKRVRKADLAIESNSKRRRIARQLAQTKENESRQVEEGGASYIAGGDNELRFGMHIAIILFYYPMRAFSCIPYRFSK
ncbi:uncharacterized protein LOC131935516, partial [Physella acuta]|uniref:uncharacterized protein LOC131935516 n=1 Tax=Physella acuta TaxID=109671 RepID=UPI0027DE8242